MSVTLSPPPDIAFSKNQIIVGFTSDDYIVTPGSKAYALIQIFFAVNAGDVFQIKWPLGSVEMVAVNGTPDESGLQFPAGGPSTAYTATVVTAFRSNYLLDRYFDIEYTTGDIFFYIRAKAPGTNYTIQNVAEHYEESTKYLGLASYPGSNLTYRPNFAHFTELWKVGTQDTLLYRANLVLDQPVTGVTQKDISDILTTALDYDVPVLDQVWQLCPKSVCHYYFKYAQTYGERPLVQKINWSDTYTACLGGYSEAALGAMTDRANFLSQSLLPAESLYKFQRWFESYPVDNFDVKTNSPQFLYFVNMRSIPEDLSVCIDVTLSDGTSQVLTIPGGTVAPMQKICIGCGYGQLGLSQYTTTENYVIAYEVKLVATINGEQRSLSKYFSVNRDHEEHTRYILYSGSDGNFKTLRTYGRSVTVAEMSDQQATRYPTLESPKTGVASRFDVRITKSDELMTGYLKGDQSLDKLEELLLAEKAYRVFGNNLVPIIITSEKLELEADEQYFFSHKIEYKLAYDERLYTGSTARLIIPRINEPQNAINDL